MGSVQLELLKRGVHLYVFARRIGTTEARLRKILKGRIKNVSDEEIEQIAKPLNLDPATVRAEIEAASVDRREEAARAA